jgi:hypothetical protein
MVLILKKMVMVATMLAVSLTLTAQSSAQEQALAQCRPDIYRRCPFHCLRHLLVQVSALRVSFININYYESDLRYLQNSCKNRCHVEVSRSRQVYSW